MPRGTRIQAAGATYHLTARGNGGATIFLDDFDRLYFLQVVARVVRELEWTCFTYCLMNNHYHLLVRTPRPDLASGMQRIQSSYVRRFNARHARQGHVFGRRYHDELVRRDEHLLSAAAYVVLNPVRAGIVERPEEWRWSSYRATVGLDACPAFLDVVSLLEMFAPDRARATALFREMVDAGRVTSRCQAPSVPGTAT